VCARVCGDVRILSSHQYTRVYMEEVLRNLSAKQCAVLHLCLGPRWPWLGSPSPPSPPVVVLSKLPPLPPTTHKGRHILSYALVVVAAPRPRDLVMSLSWRVKLTPPHLPFTFWLFS
jgi:hypothetical protein